jgi:hypothetical protein
MSAQDTISDVEIKLAAIPTNLGQLFRHLLFESHSPPALEEQSRLLQIVRAREVVCDVTRDESSSCLTVYALALADYGETIDMKLPIEQPTEHEIINICEEMKRRVTSVCASLLVLHEIYSRRARTHARFADPGSANHRVVAQNRVCYLHRTVRDFLIYSGGFEIAVQHTEVDFDAYICLLRLHVLQLRLPLGEPEQHRRLDEWWPDIVLAMTSARLAKERSQDVLVGLLKDFNGTLAWYWRAKTSDPLDY